MRLLLLAQEVEEEGPVVELVEPSRPLTELLDGWLGSGPWVRLLVGSVDVLLQVLLIVTLALIASYALRKAVERAVARAKHPPSDELARGLRQRIGMGEQEATGASLRRVQRADALGALALSVGRALVWALAVLLVLTNAFGVNLAPLIAGAGIVGVAVGFGAQGLVRDFLTGVFMLAEDQYGVGDIVDVGPASGVVEGVTLRTTKIRDVTGTLWHVPNGEISRVGNMSQEWARTLLDVAVSYGTDLDLASELILQVATDMAEEEAFASRFLATPELWGVESLGDDSVDIRVVIKTEPGQQWAIARELRRRLWYAFEAADIEIPFPQRTVWLRTEQPVALGGPDEPGFTTPLPTAEALARARTAARRAGDDAVLAAPALPDPHDGPGGDASHDTEPR